MSRTSPDIDPNSRQAIAAMIVLGLLGALITFIMPMLLGGMVDDLGLDGKRAGLVIAAELSGIAVATLSISLRISRWNRQVMGLVALLVMLCGNLASVHAEGFATLSAVRFFTGLGEGGLLGLFGAALAATHDPDRTSGIFLVFTLCLATLCFMVLPKIIQSVGIDGAFWTFAGFCLIGFPFLRWLPPFCHTHGSEEKIDGPELNVFRISLGLLATLFAFTGDGGFWVYLERIGVDRGISSVNVGKIMAAATTAGIGAATLAAWLTTRLHRAIPLTLSNICLVTGLLCIYFVDNHWAYGMSVIFYFFAWNLFLPYLMGTMAAIDPKGRAIVLCLAFQVGGLALGPALAATVLSDENYIKVIWLAAPCLAVSLATILPLALYLGNSRNSGSTSDLNNC